MSQQNSYQEKYALAKAEYLSTSNSLTEICKKYHIDRGTFSKNLKKDGVEIINRQNMTKFNENVFDIIDTREKAYWLGFLYADGAISSSRNTVELSLKSEDLKHLEKFRDFLECDSNKHIFQDEVRCRIAVTNKHLKQALINLGCGPQKSLTLTFPTKEQVPDIYLFDFVRGYIDGDGSVMLGLDYNGERTKPRLNILGTKEFLTELIQRTHWKPNKIGQRTENNVFSVGWGGKFLEEYYDQLYEDAPIYLDRKYEKYKEIKKVCRL